MKQKLILVRGLPGSGKTTFAKKYVNEHENFSLMESDMFFSNGIEYKFDKAGLASAHAWCALQTYCLINRGANVIVCNTFTLPSECAPYYVIADKLDIDLELKTMTGTYQNIHEVPEEIIELMRIRFVPDSIVASTFKKFDLFHFWSNPYEAYPFFSIFEKLKI